MTEQGRGPSTMSNLDDFWFAQGPMIHGPDQGSIDIGDLLGVADHDQDAKRLVERHNATVKALIAAARRAEELEKVLGRIVKEAGDPKWSKAFMAVSKQSIEEARALAAEGAPR